LTAVGGCFSEETEPRWWYGRGRGGEGVAGPEDVDERVEVEEWLERREVRRPGVEARESSSLVRGEELVVESSDQEGGREPRELVEAVEV
jgi:hypothetical protein